MQRYLLIISLLLFFFILPGCGNSLEINETIIPIGMGLELKGDDKVLSAQMASAQETGSGEGSSAPVLVISESGTGTWAELARRSSLSLSRSPLWAFTSSVFIGENLARKDTGLFVDILARNRFIRNNIFLFLTKGTTPEEIFRCKVQAEDYSVTTLEKTITTQEKQIGIYMPVYASDFLYKSATPGIEPVLPQVTIDKEPNAEQIKLNGTAVFLERKMVGSLDQYESRGFRFLSPKMISAGLFNLKAPEGTNNDLADIITMELIRSEAKWEPVIKDNKINIQVTIKTEGNLYEQNNLIDYSTPEMINKLEREAENLMKNNITACIAKAQLLQSDIFGWGLGIKKKHPRLWEEVKTDWPQVFSRLDTNIEVDFKLRRSYLLEKPFKFQ
jgi:spore germination protein KC